MTRSFDPDAPSSHNGLFGLPHTPEEAEVVVIPVPWEATVSYGAGTRRGPETILAASSQLDLLDRETGRPHERGIAMLPISGEIIRQGTEARELALPVIEAGTPGDDPALLEAAKRVNVLCDSMNEWVFETASGWLDQGKLVGAVGGDHSIAFGTILAAAERHPGLGILHLDAHADLRSAYEGFASSHASVMHNVLALPTVEKLVQIGIRDYSPGEEAIIMGNPGKIATFFDADLKQRTFAGEPWASLVAEVVNHLPEQVYLSFDIDGLDPSLCPNTGTPVPGGLSFPETTSLLRAVVESGRKIVGFDLSEVAPDPSGKSEWDGNVGARLLYKMIGFALMTRPSS
jgi:agmatinase